LKALSFDLLESPWIQKCQGAMPLLDETIIAFSKKYCNISYFLLSSKENKKKLKGKR